MMAEKQNSDIVTLSIDGQEAQVPKGTTIIEAAKSIGIEIPHFCYHPCLEIAGNCRICQVEVAKAPKLMLACHSEVQPGMVVNTHHTSEKVREAQASILEFILINHPLDCTVCDQAGHCKLQDYYYEYDAQPSRFLEKKELKVKAEPLGPTIMLDAERCISCTRCVRFCREVTKTDELGLLNRGDRGTIAINQKRPLNNPLAGTVVDLCPVGALTHKGWRFNTRLWFADEVDTVCPLCPTGCNIKAYVRDNKVVCVKGRFNEDINKEWLCDEGRYGLDEFLPEYRVTEPLVQGEAVSWELALQACDKLKSEATLLILAPDLFVEEYALIKTFAKRYLKEYDLVLAYQERSLNEAEAVLMSPSRAANYQGAQYVGLVSGNLADSYGDCFRKLQSGKYQNVLIVGDRALCAADAKNRSIVDAVTNSKFVVSIIADANSFLAEASTVLLPAKSVLEKSGLYVNRNLFLQYFSKLMQGLPAAKAHWQVINEMSAIFGKPLVEAKNDQAFTDNFLASDDKLAGLTVESLMEHKVCLEAKE